MPDPAEQAASPPAAASAEVSEFESLLNKEFKPKTDEAKSAVKQAVPHAGRAGSFGHDPGFATTSSRRLKPSSRRSTASSPSSSISSFTMRTSRSSKAHGAGCTISSTTRKPARNLKIRVMNISKKDLGKTLKRYKGTAWDQSPLFKKIYEEEFGTSGGEPFGCLIGDYYFDHTRAGCGTAGRDGADCRRRARAVHHRRVPTLMKMESWQELINPRDLTKIFLTPEYAAWKSLRESEDSRYVGLAMPRYLSRLPYSAKTNPVDDFAFEEDTAAADHTATCGPMPRMRWPRTSPAPSSCTAGVRGSAAWNPAASWKVSRSTPSPPTTAAWT